MIDCKYWSSCKRFFRGHCILNKFNGNPTFGQCVDLCGLCNNDREWLDDYISKLPKTEISGQKEKREKQQAEITAAVAKLPSKFQMVKNLGKHAITVANHYLKTGRVKITDEHEQARETECRACDKHKIVDGSLRCTLKSCGCHLTGELGRLAFEALPCDDNKHDLIDKRYLDLNE